MSEIHSKNDLASEASYGYFQNSNAKLYLVIWQRHYVHVCKWTQI